MRQLGTRAARLGLQLTQSARRAVASDRRRDLRCGMRSLALVAIATLMVGAAAARASDLPGELRVQGRFIDDGSVYFEGAYQYVSVRRARDGKLLFTRRG